MKNFVLSVVASLVASVVFLAFSFLSSAFGLIVIFAVLSGLLMIFALYIIVANRCSKNPIRKMKLKGCRIGIVGRKDSVVFDSISLVRPNYIKYTSDNGASGYVHYSKVIVFV